MAKQKKAKKQKPLEQVLMESCNKLRSNMSGINYMYFVMELVFLKFAYLKFEKRREEILNSEDKDLVEMEQFYREKNVFYIPEKARWSYIVKNSKSDKLGIIIDEALELMEKSNKSLRNALATNAKDGSNENRYSKATLPKEKFAALIAEIDKLHEDEDHPMNDLIGKTYQYMLNAFAIKTADEKGEFYTPDNIVDLITTIIEPYSGRVYDPCCGSGGMFIQSYKFVESHKGNIKDISIYGQESNPDTWKLAKMNLGIRGITADLGKHEADTFSDDQHKGVLFDYIIANPPFNLPNWRGKDELKDDPRWAGYGLPPTSNANYAWILHMISKLSFNGMAGFLLANGALGDTDTKEIRKNLIKSGKIDAIIILPREMFYYTPISVTLWIINNNPLEHETIKNGKKVVLRDRRNDVLFMDLRTKGKKSKDGYFELSQQDMDEVKYIFDNWSSKNWKENYKDIPEFCQSCKLHEIKNGVTDKMQELDGTNIDLNENKSNWSLVPSKYIEFIDRDLKIDFNKEITRIRNQMKSLLDEEEDSQKQLKAAFKGIGYEIK